MIELAAGQATPALRALFPASGHTYRRAFAVLDGLSGGRVLTDDPESPAWAAVQERSDDCVTILTGALNRELVHELIRVLRRERITTIGLTSDDPLLALLPDDPDYDGFDIDFEDRDPSVDLERVAQPPNGLRLARIDDELAPRCAWQPWMSDTTPSALTHGLGYCLLDGDVVISEAFAGPAVEGVLEMAVITHQDYQRRGLGTIVSARTVLECERLGNTTWWNTSTTNHGSARIARTLGYRTERQYRLLAWYQSPA